MYVVSERIYNMYCHIPGLQHRLLYYRYKGLSLLEPNTGKPGTWRSQDKETRKKEPGRLGRERTTLPVIEILILLYTAISILLVALTLHVVNVPKGNKL